MNGKIITGAVLALAAGVAAFIYNRNRHRINDTAADLYNATRDAVDYTKNDIETAIS